MEGLRGLAVLLVYFVHVHSFFGQYLTSCPRLYSASEYLGRVGNAGVATSGAEGYEAEDVIGALVPGAPGPVAIVSGDRDLFQLVRDPTVRVLYPKRGVSDLAVIDEAEIERRYGIPGTRYFDFAVLRGDPSDGLPGVRGIGEKTAGALLAKYGSLDAVVEAARGATSGPLQKVASSLDYIERARTVVRIATEAPVGEKIALLTPITLPVASKVGPPELP